MADRKHPHSLRSLAVGLLVGLILGPLAGVTARAATAGHPSAEDLTLVAAHRTAAVIVSRPGAGPLETRAARDLASYIEKMSGVAVPIVATQAEVDRALASDAPLVVLGETALKVRPDLRRRLTEAVKQKPVIRADGIVLEHRGRRLYVAGSNDRSHYFAAAELLRQWGVRWFMPGRFGECVPDESELKIGDLDKVEATPFEIRTFVVGWLGDQTGIDDFKLHNMMTDLNDVPPFGHSLGKYTAGLAKDNFSFPLTAPATARHVADAVDRLFAGNQSFSLAMEDGIYASDDPADTAESHLRWDPVFDTWSVTDPMLTLYGNVLDILRKRHPDSTSRIGFLAYLNMTLPPVEPHHIDRALFAEIAPIGVDPIHGIGDPRSPERSEYGRNVEAWSKVMGGRVAIYDYDQSMLVWRDLPNPSHMAFAKDVKFYEKAGILGVWTESRNAIATTFTNLYLRARLMWDPQQNVDALLDDFYVRFYGPAAKPMARYWSRIFAAWGATRVTEHEFFLAPAIYTRPLLDSLRAPLDEAERALRPLAAPGRRLTANETLYVERVRFTRLSYRLIDAYIAMVEAGARDGDYRAAVAAGERGLGVRAQLAAMDKSFSTVALETGNFFWFGEVHQYEDLEALTDGARGTLVARLPLSWNVRREATGGFDRPAPTVLPDQDEAGAGWQAARTDLYLEAQDIFADAPKNSRAGVRYKTSFDLAPGAGAHGLRLHFPGVFGTCRLYIDGRLAGERRQDALWWMNDYRFDWDLALPRTAVEGRHALTLGCASDGHQSGIFRRPFIYAAADAGR